jgi:hypothetical protein
MLALIVQTPKDEALITPLRPLLVLVVVRRISAVNRAGRDALGMVELLAI